MNHIPVNTKADLAPKPKVRRGHRQRTRRRKRTTRNNEKMKKCRVCAKKEVEGHKVFDSRKMQPERGLSRIVDCVFFIIVNDDRTDQGWETKDRG